jgi:uncharacterized delta-60 repeat protein
MRRGLAAAACLVLVSFGIASANGNGDGTFSIVSIQPDGVDKATSLGTLVMQPGGEIVAAGSIGGFNSPRDLLLVRVTSSGAFDPSFGTDGIVRTSIAALDTMGGAVLRPDGTIIAAGGAGTNESTLTAVLLRYQPDGTLDPTFGTGGVVTTGLAGSASEVIRQPDGALVTTVGNVIARFLDDGSPDPTFGAGGVVSAAHPLNQLVRQPGGALVAAGRSGNDVRLLRVLADGTPDPAFGTGGSVTISFPDTVTLGALRLHPDGRLVIGGGVGLSPMGLLLAQLLPDGTLDPSFAGGGILPTIETGFVGDLALDHDGNILVTGSRNLALPFMIEGIFERYSPTGVRDYGFAAGFNGSQRAMGAMLVQPDARILAANLLIHATFTPQPTTLIDFTAQIRRYHGVGTCGDGVVDPGEQCDSSTDPCCTSLTCRFNTAPCASDDNTCTIDRCEAGVCAHIPGSNNVSCNDGNLCTHGDRCMSGVCAGFPGPTPPCRRCVPETGDFVAGPRLDCKQTTQPGKSSLTITDAANPSSDKLTWKWTRGEATTVAELGHPAKTSPVDGLYPLCVFDESGTEPVVLAMTMAPAGHLSCVRPPCWVERGNRATYKSALASFWGATGMVLTAGGAGQSSMRVTGKGANLFSANPHAPPLPASPLPLPLRVQLGVLDDGACWEATFSATGVRKNSGGKFVAKSD